MRRLFRTLMVVAAIAANRGIAGELWHNAWIVQSQPFFQGQAPNPDDPLTTFGFGANGDLIIAATPSRAGWYAASHELSAIDHAGVLRWASGVTVDDSPVAGFRSLLADGAGGFFMVSEGSYANRVARHAPDGRLLWARNLDASWQALSTDNRLAILGCGHIALVDIADGRVAWQRATGSHNVSGCKGGLAVDAAGYLYAGIETLSPGGVEPGGFRVTKLDSDGNPLWDIPTTDATLVGMIGTNGANTFVQTTTGLRALRSSDGSTAWMLALAEDARVLMAGGSSPEPVVVDAQSVGRVAADTGQVRWRQAVEGLTGVAGIVGDAVVVSGSAGITRIDLASGAIDWAGVGAGIDWVGFGGLHESSFVGVAGNPANVYESLVKRISVADGAIADVPLPPVPTGIDAGSVVDGEGAVVSAGLTQQPDHASLHARRVDPATGSTVWDVTDPDLCCVSLWSLAPPAIATDSGSVVTTFVTASGCTDDTNPFLLNPGFAAISVRELADGNPRWRVVLHEEGEGCVQISTPAIDVDGNVYATMSSLIVRVDSQGVTRFEGHQKVFKFAATTGTQVWHLDQIVPALPFATPPQPFSLIGSDLLLAAPVGAAENTLQRVSGINGASVWSTSVFPDRYIQEQPRTIDAHHVAVFSASGTDVAWASVDTDTGQVQWTAVAPLPACVPPAGCSLVSEPAVQWNGDTVGGGEFDYQPILACYRNDGSGIADRWILGPGDASVRGGLPDVWVATSTTLNALLHRGFRSSQGSLRFLSTFDAANGTLSPGQTVYSFTPNEPWTLPTSLHASVPDRLLARTFGSIQGEPATSGVTLFDTHVAAHGNLSVVIALDSPEVQTGQLVGFHLTASYAGDAPLVGVRVAAVFPWQSGIRAPACTASGCVTDTSVGNMDATFDIAPGGTAVITGQVLVLDQAILPSVSARIWGPTSLAEDDLVDNFTQVTPQQSLFVDGFDD